MAARDAVGFSFGPVYEVETGRRDGFVSNFALADTMPDFRDSIQLLKQKFFQKRLNEKDLVLLSGFGRHNMLMSMMGASDANSNSTTPTSHALGRIPHALGNLLEIESLDLSCNQLTGEIPQSLADLTFLEFLNLLQNHLMGRIPNGKQFDTFEVNSFGGNPQLCGLPLPKKCEHPHEPQLETDGDAENGFSWRVVMLGYGCGMVLGLVMGYLMLSTGRPKWFNAIADAGEHMIQKRKNKRRYVFIGK